MKMNRVRMRSLIQEVDPNTVALGRANGGTGHLSVVGPRRIEDARRNFELSVDGKEVVLA